VGSRSIFLLALVKRFIMLDAGDAQPRHGDFLDRAEDVAGAPVEVPHGVFAGEPPTRSARGKGPIPVQEWQFDHLVGQDPTADHARDVVDIVAGGDPDVRTGSVDDRVVEPAEATDVDVSL